MIRYECIGLISLLLWSIPVGAQVSIIRGAVADAETRQPLAFCSLVLLHTFNGTQADAQGKFQLTLPKSKTKQWLMVSYIGYKSDTVLLSPTVKDYIVYLKPNAGTLNEVMVTVVSRATLAKENPAQVSVISAKTIDQTNANNIIDNLAQNVPGLTPVKTGPNVSKPFINGLGYNRVLTLYDGMRVETQQWGDEHGVPVDDYNIEKAEVIMGPASLMYGSDALAGVVSLFQPVPQRTNGEIHGRVLSEYQSNNGLVGNAFRLGYSGKHWLWMIRGSERIAKNYQNAIDGRVYNTGFRMENASGVFGYNGRKGYSHLNFSVYNNLQGIPDGSRDSVTRQFTKQVYEIPQDNIKDRPVVSDHELNSYSLSALHQHIQDYRLYSVNHYRFGENDINICVGIEQNSRREYDHPTDPQQAGMYVRLNTLNYGLRYNAPSILNIEPSLGISGMYQNNTSMNATDFPIPDYNLLDVGAYGYAKWKHKKWTISGGVRYDTRHLSGDRFYTKQNPGDGFTHQVNGNDTVGATLQFPALHKTFSGITSSIGTTFNVNDRICFKINIARGYRSPNITEIASNGLDPGAHIVYEGDHNAVPEFSLQEDIGLSEEFRDITVGLSAFNNNIQHYLYEAQLTDIQGNPVIIVPGNKTFQYQQANAQIYGIVAVLNIHPKTIKGFSFNNSFTATYGFNRDLKYNDMGVNGEYLPFIPPVRVMSAVNQKLTFKNKEIRDVELRIAMEYNAAQQRYLALYNTETYTPGYSIINISATISIRYFKDKTVNIQLHVNNLFNTAYQSNLSRLKYFEYYKASPNNRLGIYDMGRNICIKMILPF